jgi:hypothetical protein
VISGDNTAVSGPNVGTSRKRTGLDGAFWGRGLSGVVSASKSNCVERYWERAESDVVVGALGLLELGLTLWGNMGIVVVRACVSLSFERVCASMSSGVVDEDF